MQSSLANQYRCGRQGNDGRRGDRCRPHQVILGGAEQRSIAGGGIVAGDLVIGLDETAQPVAVRRPARPFDDLCPVQRLFHHPLARLDPVRPCPVCLVALSSCFVSFLNPAGPEPFRSICRGRPIVCVIALTEDRPTAWSIPGHDQEPASISSSPAGRQQDRHHPDRDRDCDRSRRSDLASGAVKAVPLEISLGTPGPGSTGTWPRAHEGGHLASDFRQAG